MPSCCSFRLEPVALVRIYDKNENDKTQGHGATMTFKGVEGFTEDQVRNLMNCIRIVFFDPTAGEDSQLTVFANAKLDMSKAKSTVDGLEAPIYIYKNVNTAGEKETAKYEEQPVKDNVITALQQNTPQKISCLVYLDGATIQNKDVAYNSSKSVTGKMNLQFASDANLVPMEYADLHTVTPGGTEEESKTVDVKFSEDDGIEGDKTATKGIPYSFTVDAEHQLTGINIGGQPIDVLPTGEPEDAKQLQTFTIPGEKITGVIVISTGLNP